jgi:hypothetical protein
MFERYTEKARRVIFFSRYEASQFGSPAIGPEHLLLGLLREDKRLFHRYFRDSTSDWFRQRIEAQTPSRPSFPTSVDLPLSSDGKRVLHFAMEEADRLSHTHISTEHLLLGLLHLDSCLAAQLLHEQGAVLEDLRLKLAEEKPEFPDWKRPSHGTLRTASRRSTETVEIHGALWNIDFVRDAVKECTKIPWHWHRQTWAPRDVTINPTDGHISFDLTLAGPPTNFPLVKGGWKQDHCAVCRWLLTSSDDASHDVGYTNGKDWLCTECYEKFVSRPNFFSSTDSDIT